MILERAKRILDNLPHKPSYPEPHELLRRTYKETVNARWNAQARPFPAYWSERPKEEVEQGAENSIREYVLSNSSRKDLAADEKGYYFWAHPDKSKDGSAQKLTYFFKIYGAIKTRHCIPFFDSIRGFVRENEEVEFGGKFYEAEEQGSHNKLVLYVPFEHFQKVVAFLHDHKDVFHDIENNHPAGIHLLPGVSAVIANGERVTSFDAELQKVLGEAYSISKDQQAFLENAKRLLLQNPRTEMQFRLLFERGGTPPAPEWLKEAIEREKLKTHK